MENKTIVVPLSCGHTHPFTLATIKRNGLPKRWYCIRCRRSFYIDVDEEKLEELLKED
jgi:hypothetical protein